LDRKNREKVQYNNAGNACPRNRHPEIVLRHLLRLSREGLPLADD